MSGIPYSRPPRSYPEPLPEEPFEIAPPPAVVQGAAGGSILLYLLPALASLASIGFIFTFPGAQRSQALLLLVGAIVVLSVLSGFLMWWLQRGTQRSRRRWERRRYLEYLGRVQTELDGLAARQSTQLRELHPDLASLEALARQRERVWERRRGDADFLRVGLGRGRVPLSRRVLLQANQNNPLVEYDGDLLQRAQALVAKYAELDGVPVEADLRELGWLGVEGDAAAAADVIRALLLEACVLGGPDELQVAVVADGGRLGDWAWVKWLPHCRRSRRARTGGEQSAALIASAPAALEALLRDLVRPRLARASASGGAGVASQVMPHLLLVVDGPEAAGRLDRLPDADRLAMGRESGLTLLRLGSSSAAATARIEVEGSGLLSYEEAGFGGRRAAAVRAGRADPGTAERIARALAPLRLEEKEAVRDLGDEVRLAQLLGLESFAELDAAQSWAEEPRYGLLRIPVGERLDGNSVVLDFKEAAEGGMGPHGLIVGATGSGKSELLRTVVCALAATHDPDLLSFVFVDFKGGASFADLARLPHSAGMITNLEGDLTLVDRMQSALFGEMERRQRLLREAGNADNIRVYRARRRSTPALPPLPYLLVIVDEFGELLANRPDFLELFVTLGRVGRSLGIHLLLATQRLDEGRIRGLEGYLRYRICLRTFSPEESSAVLGTPAAHHLPPYPGTAYLKVDGPLELFKVALVSTPSETGSASPIREFTAGGELLGTPAAESGEAEATDMETLVEALASAGEPRHQVWLPPLPVRLTLGEVSAAWRADLRGGPPPEPPFGPLSVVVGETDLPRAQRREPLLLDFSGVGGHLAVVGAPQSGKSTLLRTLVTAFALTHSPDDVQFYVVDLGGGLLRSLQDFPHVGAVAGKAERERLLQVVHHAASVIDEREAIFREHGLDGMAGYRRLRAAGRLPEARYGDVFLVVDDVGQAQAEVEQVEPELIRIATAGLSYGVHLIVTGNRWADLRPKLRDAIGSRLELRLNDPADSELGRQAAATLPVGIPGRGLTRDALHFQAALPLVGGVQPEGVAQWARQAWPATAPPVLSLPSLVNASELPPGAVALEQTRLSALTFDLENGDPHFLVFGDAEAGKTNLLRTWIRALAAIRAPAEAALHVVDYRRSLTDTAALPHVRVAVSPEEVTALVGDLLAELGSRQPPGLGERWAGQHEYLFVDDYDWVTSASGNPLGQLADLLLQGRDIGFHVILARRVGGTTRSSYEPFFQRLREMSPAGLILDGDPHEGPLLGAVRAQPLPPGRGLLVRRGHQPIPVQVAFSPVRPGVVKSARGRA